MSNKILIAYATWAGSTQSVAEFIAKTLQEKNPDVDVVPASKVKDIAPYDVVILGTAVRAGMLHNDAHKFVQRFASLLPAKKVAYFEVGMTMSKDTPENRKQADSYLDALVSLAPDVKLLARGTFAGVMDPARLKGFVRILMSKTAKLDARDWDAVRAWTLSLLPKF